MPLDHEPVMRWGALLLILVLTSAAWSVAFHGHPMPWTAILGYLAHLAAIYLVGRRLGRALRQG